MTFPIWPQVIYPIGDLPDGKYYVVVSERDFSYCRDLPDLFEEDWEEDWDDTEPDIHIEWDSNPYARSADETLDKAS